MTKIILTKGVREYRQTISKYVRKTDTVLEIGFAWGTTTNTLSKVCKKVVGIDKGESYFTAVKTYPNIQFEKLDGFEVGKVLKLGYKFNIVFIDISGCRGIHDVIKIIQMYKSAFNPRIIVVKSSRLKRFVAMCKVWGNLQE
jgi:hypothetical protein